MTYTVSRAAVKAFYEAYASHDTARLAPLLHDDIEWTISGPVEVLAWCGKRRGKAAVIDLVDRLIPSLFRVVTLAQEAVLIDGDRAATLTGCRRAAAPTAVSSATGWRISCASRTTRSFRTFR